MVQKITPFPISRLLLACPAMGYWLFSALFHLRAAHFIVSFHETPLGRIKPADYSFHFGIIAGTLYLLYMLYNLFFGAHRMKTVFYLFLWVLAVGVSDAFLITTPNEYVHFPQYALLAALLCMSVDPCKTGRHYGPVFLTAVFAGFLDEVFQYLFIQPTYTLYFDFNDLILNTLGAAAGMTAYYGFRDMPALTRRDFKRLIKRMMLFSVVASIGIAAFTLTGRVVVSPPQVVGEVPPGGVVRIGDKKVLVLERKKGWYGQFHKTMRDHDERFYILSPFEGSAWLFITWAVFRSYAIQYKPGK